MPQRGMRRDVGGCLRPLMPHGWLRGRRGWRARVWARKKGRAALLCTGTRMAGVTAHSSSEDGLDNGRAVAPAPRALAPYETASEFCDRPAPLLVRMFAHKAKSKRSGRLWSLWRSCEARGGECRLGYRAVHDARVTFTTLQPGERRLCDGGCFCRLVVLKDH